MCPVSAITSSTFAGAAINGCRSARLTRFRQRTPELFDGYVKPDRILVRTEAWRRYCNGVDPAEIARHFQQRGALIADDNGVSKAEQVIGKVERFYVLSRAALTP